MKKLIKNELMILYLPKSKNIECAKNKLQLYKSIQVIITYLTVK